MKAFLVKLEPEVARQLAKEAEEQRPRVKPGPWAAEIIRRYFEEKDGQKEEGNEKV